MTPYIMSVLRDIMSVLRAPHRSEAGLLDKYLIGRETRPGYGRRAELLIVACRGIYGPADDYAKLQCPLFGIL